ncbi:hypothetical protein ACFX1Z_039942 [Malus domestica]
MSNPRSDPENEQSSLCNPRSDPENEQSLSPDPKTRSDLIGGENWRRIERLREKKKDGETEGEGWTERLRDPGAVVEPPLGVHVDAAKARRGQQLLEAVGEVGGARGGVLDLVHGSGEAIEVVDGAVAARNGADGGDSGVPVAGDDEDGEKRWGAEEETRRLWEKDRESPARIPLRF